MLAVAGDAWKVGESVGGAALRLGVRDEAARFVALGVDGPPVDAIETDC